MIDSLGDRMKAYEAVTQFRLQPRTYTIIRIDGKSFHTYTRNLIKPYDKDLNNDMFATATLLCGEIMGAKLAYSQSDEISILLTDFDKLTTQGWFDNKLQKVCSVSASLATSIFNTRRFEKLGFNVAPANFDSRVFQLPTSTEVENYFVWRQKDAIRNSISMLAQSLYSHKELQGKKSKELKAICWEKGQNFDEIPKWLTHGRLYSKVLDMEISSFNFLDNRDYLTDLVTMKKVEE